MEGGYAVEEIGINVVNLLSGFLNGWKRNNWRIGWHPD